jgi:hypothetical protein
MQNHFNRRKDALIVDAIGGGLCKKHGKYFGHGRHELADCPFCDIDLFFRPDRLPLMLWTPKALAVKP